MNEPSLASNGIKVNHYLNRITWTFANDQGRKLYLSTRRSIWYEILIGYLTCAVFALAFPYPVDTSFAVIGLGLITFVAMAVPWTLLALARRSRLLESVEVDFRRFEVCYAETMLIPWLLWQRRLAMIETKRITSITWGADGVLIEHRRLGRRVTFFLSYHLLRTNEAMEVFVKWADRIGIEIDGVRPLPGGYVRPQQEPRGL